MAKQPQKTQPPVSKAEERDSALQDGFLREVDEALREEQLVAMVKQYAKPVGGGIAALLLALGGYLLWQNSVQSSSSDRSEKEILAFDKIQAGQIDAAAKDIEPLLKDGSAGSRAVAAMNLAAIAMAKGNAQDAARKFAAIAADGEMPKPFRDLATVREITIRFDSMKPDEVISRLKPLAVPGNPFFGTAGELLGLAYMDAGKPDLAGALFAQIGKDNSISKSIRGRARMLAGGLGYDGGAELPPETPNTSSSAPPAAAPAK